MGIYQKGANWFIDYYYEGRRIREKVGPNKTLAKHALIKRKADMMEGRFFPRRQRTDMLFKDLAEYYWELHGKYKRTKSYRLMLKQLLAAFREMPLGRITVPAVLEYRNRVKERASAATANRHLSFLRSIFYKAREWGKFQGENPAARIKLDRENNHRLRYLSEDEIKRLLAACDPRIYPFVVCALLTGMRRGEIFNLCWENADLEHEIFYVLQSKSGKPREIPISAKLGSVLKGLGPKDKGPVFDLPEITLRRLFAKALKDAQITDFRFHDIRHTFASHFIMRTGDLPALQKLLGHQSSMMTQRYAHLAASHLKMGIGLLDSGMDTFWTPRALGASEGCGARRGFSLEVPIELLNRGAVAQGLERAFHKR